MYSIEQIVRGLSHPNYIGRELNRLYFRRGYSRPFNIEGIDIFDEDWDNLLILDACRYDMFEELSTLPGRLESRTSRGSTTVEFLKANLSDRNLHDTVYVTANPQLHRHFEDIQPEFHDVHNVWSNAGWDREFNTVLPETMRKYTIEVAEDYPNKRILAHFIQPHYPFLVENSVFESDRAFVSQDKPGGWNQIMRGDLSLSSGDVWPEYNANLERVLPEVAKLLEKLAGKTVVTSDHGNMVGERSSPVPIREWGHPHSTYTEELVKVPWLVTRNGQKEIKSEETVFERSEAEQDVLEGRLADLGYM